MKVLIKSIEENTKYKIMKSERENSEFVLCNTTTRKKVITTFDMKFIPNSRRRKRR